MFSPTAVALPFSNCDQAEAAGAAPVFAGQPGYSAELDRDGDGVACEQGNGSASPLRPSANTYTTLIAWDGAPCIDVIWPNNNQMIRQNICHEPGEVKLIFHTAAPGQLIGADPIIGAANGVACSVMRDSDKAILIRSDADAGDGRDVNCTIAAS